MRRIREIPDTFICSVLDSISSRILSHLTVELSRPSQVGKRLGTLQIRY